MPKRIKADSNEGQALELAKNLIAASLAGRDKDKVIERASRWDRYYWGDQPAKARSKIMGNKVYNKFAEIVENRLARITQERPKWEFKPQEEDDSAVAYVLNKIVGDIVWEYIDWDERSEEAIIECMAAGSGHLKIGVDATGWPTVIPVPCEQVLPDHQAKSIEEAKYIGWIFAKRVEEIKEIYGVNVNAENTQDNYSDRGDFNQPKASDVLSASSTNRMVDVWGALSKSLRRRGLTDIGILPQAVVVELWFDDLTLEAIPFDVDETNQEHRVMAELQEVEVLPRQNHPKHIKEHEIYLNTLDPDIDADVIKILTEHIETHKLQPQKTKRRKYPDGRIITVCQGKLLRDEPFALGEHWKQFVVKWDWIKSRKNYWGKPAGFDLFDRQDALNHRKNSITANTNLLNVGIRKIRKGTYKDGKPITNLIGQNIPVNNPDDITVDFGKPLPAHFFQDLLWEERGMETQEGIEAPLAGRLPSPGTSGTAVEQLIQQGLVRGALPIKHYLQALKKMARAILYIVTEFEPLTLKVEYEGQQYSPAVLKGLVGINDIRINLTLDVPFRERLFNEAIQLYQAGVYDRQAVLEALDDPNKVKVMQRLSEIEQMKLIIEQLTQEREQLVKEINTFKNRQQDEQGRGNVGSIPL